MIRALALLLALLLAASPARAFLMLDGPMPSLTGRKPVAPPRDPRAFDPAPRPDLDAQAPVPRERPGVVVSPGLTNRSAQPNPTGNSHVPGSAFSDSLNRNNRRGSELGGTLAPSLNLRMPLP
jgi:hypothetical protein